MTRFLCALVTGSLVAAAAVPAQADPAGRPCTAVTFSSTGNMITEPQNRFGVISGAAVVPGATATTIWCGYRYLPSGEVQWIAANTTAGPATQTAGVLQWFAHDLENSGIEVCTLVTWSGGGRWPAAGGYCEPALPSVPVP